MGRIPSSKRLGVYQNPLAPRGQTRYVYDDPIAHARSTFLMTLGQLEPRILTELRKIARVDDDADDARLRTWARRWHLADAWALDYARATVALYRGFDTKPETLAWSDTDSGVGALWGSEPIPKAVVISPRHLDWLAAYHLRPSDKTLAAIPGVTPDGVRKAIIRTAECIGLTLRPAKRGNPTFGTKRPTKTTKPSDTRQRIVRNLLRDLGH